MLNPGSNTKDHRAFLTVEGVDWGEFEEMDAPETTVNNEERFYGPGSAYESSGGGVFQIGTIEGKRHWRIGRDELLVKQFDDAADKGQHLEGVVSYFTVTGGVIAATPYRAYPIFVSKCKGADVNSASAGAMFEVGLSTTGGPQ